MSNFEDDPLYAKIQGLSVQVGELFAELYKNNSPKSNEALEAYKNLRRLLPREKYLGVAYMWNRHIGATAAHKATQTAATFNR